MESNKKQNPYQQGLLSLAEKEKLGAVPVSEEGSKIYESEEFMDRVSKRKASEFYKELINLHRNFAELKIMFLELEKKVDNKK